MAYQKTNWVDRSVQYPNRFTRTTDGTYDTLTPAPGTVTTPGTPITAAALNKLETQYEEATTPGPWQSITYQNNYRDYGGNYGPVQCRKKPDGRVVFRGACCSVGILEPATIGIIPSADYYPPYDMAFPSVDNKNNHCTVIIRKNGTINVMASTGYDVDTAFISLDGIGYETK